MKCKSDYIGYAIICVVMGHVISSYHETGLYKDNHLFNFTHQFVYSFHMALFYIISGFLVASGKKRCTKGKRVLQILINYGIPYVVFSAVWVVAKLLMAGHTNSAVTIKDLTLILVFPISFMWFIYALMLMQVIQVFLHSDNKAEKGLHLLAACGCYFLQPYLARVLTEFHFSDCIISDFLKNYVFFLLGVYVSEYAIKTMKNHRTIVLVLSGILLSTGNIAKYIDFVSCRFFAFILAIAGSICVITLSIIIREERALEYIGKHSLPIYVLQGIAIAASRLMITRLHMNIVYGVVPLIICTITGCLLPLCAYWIITKIGKLEGCFYPGRYIKVMK